MPLPEPRLEPTYYFNQNVLLQIVLANVLPPAKFVYTRLRVFQVHFKVNLSEKWRLAPTIVGNQTRQCLHMVGLRKKIKGA